MCLFPVPRESVARLRGCIGKPCGGVRYRSLHFERDLRYLEIVWCTLDISLQLVQISRLGRRRIRHDVSGLGIVELRIYSVACAYDWCESGHRMAHEWRFVLAGDSAICLEEHVQSVVIRRSKVQWIYTYYLNLRRVRKHHLSNIHGAIGRGSAVADATWLWRLESGSPPACLATTM